MATSSTQRIFLLLGGVLLLAGLYAWSGYNGLVTASAAVEGSWAQVETQYQRRFDLVPNLVRTVQGAAAFEQSTIAAVTQARSGWQAGGSRAQQIGAAQSFDSALSRLLVTVEAYPDLKATQAYKDLMVQLEGTENRIATARKDYNDSVMSYNVLVRRFPKNILASLFGFEAESFFDSTPGSENAPTVDFTSSSAS